MSHPITPPAPPAAAPTQAQQRQADADYGLFGTPAQPPAGQPATTPGQQPAQPAQQPVTPAATDPAQQPAAPAVGPDGQPWDPQRAMNTIQTLRAEQKTADDARKAAEQRSKDLLTSIGKLVDPNGAENTPPDPAKITADLQQASERARQAQVQLAVWQQAGPAGADPARVMGWMPFQEAIRGLDPNAADFSAQVAAKLQAEVAASPWLAATAPQAAPANPAAPAAPQAPAVSGAPIAGGVTPVPITEAQLASMSHEETVAALNEGRLNHLL